jgi:broad specificity phosphatase PhoE
MRLLIVRHAESQGNATGNYSVKRHVIRELLNVMLCTRRLIRFPHDNCGMTSLTFADVWMLDYCNRSMNTRLAREDKEDNRASPLDSRASIR